MVTLMLWTDFRSIAVIRRMFAVRRPDNYKVSAGEILASGVNPV